MITIRDGRFEAQVDLVHLHELPLSSIRGLFRLIYKAPEEHREAIKALESWISAAIERGQKDVGGAARAYRDQYRKVSPYSRSVADYNQRRLNNDLKCRMREAETHIKRLCKIQAALTAEAEKIRKD